MPDPSGASSALPGAQANDRPLLWPPDFPPTDRWKSFFIGIRRLGPDVSFFKALREHQQCRTAAALDLWADPHERAVAEALGKALQRELGWKTPWFIPADALCAVMGGPSFADWFEIDLWDVFLELDENIGLNKGPEFWKGLLDWEDRSVLLGDMVGKLSPMMHSQGA